MYIRAQIKAIVSTTDCRTCAHGAMGSPIKI